jgi:hypothetical protein
MNTLKPDYVFFHFHTTFNKDYNQSKVIQMQCPTHLKKL